MDEGMDDMGEEESDDREAVEGMMADKKGGPEGEAGPEDEDDDPEGGPEDGESDEDDEGEPGAKRQKLVSGGANEGEERVSDAM